MRSPAAMVRPGRQPLPALARSGSAARPTRCTRWLHPTAGVTNAPAHHRVTPRCRRPPPQATRQLSRVGLDAPLVARLAERNVLTARDLFQRTPLDLVELLDLPHETVRHILTAVAARIVLPPQTVRGQGVNGGALPGALRVRVTAQAVAPAAEPLPAALHPNPQMAHTQQVSEMLRAAVATPLHLRTSLPPLDTALSGGLPAGSITEVGAAAYAKPAGPRWRPCMASAPAASRGSGGVPAGLPTPRPRPRRPAPPQVVGPAGLGKTQLCLQMAVLGCLERQEQGAAVAYIDTESKFNARR